MAQLSDARRARYRQEIEASEPKFNNTPRFSYFKLPVGVTKVRVLPGIDPSSPDKDFFCKAGSHYYANPNNQKIPVTCPRIKNPKSNCPVCDKVHELQKSANKADNGEAEKLKVKIKYVMALIPREGEDAGKVLIYSAPKAIYSKLLSMMEDPDFGDITDPYDGMDVKFSRTGTGKDTRYDVLPSPRHSALSENSKEVEELLANQPELWRFREAPSVDEIEKFMNGEISRFTTGGFALKTQTDIVEVPVPVAVSAPVTLVEEEDTEEEEPEPVKPVKKSKFSNLDKIRQELG